MRKRSWISVSCLALALASIGTGVFRGPAESDARRAALAAGVVLRLNGPNDGEPINSRILRLKLSTDYSQQASFYISVEGILLDHLSFNALRQDPSTGLLSTSIDIDIERLHTLLPSRFESPDALPLSFVASLYRESPTSLVTFAEWSGYVGRPWLEFAGHDLDRDGFAGRNAGAWHEPKLADEDSLPLGTLAIFVHPLPSDTYYIVVASKDPALLRLSPENSRVFREGTILAGENWHRNADGTSPQNVIYADIFADLPSHPAYVVLWTHDFYVGWKRSAIFAVPR